MFCRVQNWKIGKLKAKVASERAKLQKAEADEAAGGFGGGGAGATSRSVRRKLLDEAGDRECSFDVIGRYHFPLHGLRCPMIVLMFLSCCRCATAHQVIESPAFSTVRFRHAGMFECDAASTTSTIPPLLLLLLADEVGTYMAHAVDTHCERIFEPRLRSHLFSLILEQ